MTPLPDIAKYLEAHRGERHAIIMHAFPDPDAIASAFAHRLISARYDIETAIFYSGKISHAQNTALVKRLGVELHRDDEDVNWGLYQGAVFVDNQGTTSEILVKALEAASVPTLVVVDHHDLQERLKPEFTDIRRVGATATIYADYLERGLLEMDKSQRDVVVAATALMHGLMTDTGGLIQAGADDFKAAGYLSQYRDADLLGQIMSQNRSKQTMEIIRRALADRVLIESFSIAGIGYLRSEDRDAIPQAADFLLTEENIHSALVFGILSHADHQEETIAGSMRTSKITVSPDEFIKEAFGQNAAGHYYGGGRATAGAFEIPVGFLSGDHTEEYRQQKWQVCEAQVKHKLLVKIGVEQKRVN
jgi:nanoRNase/pAp phosphatase (c-di-AMP/oligoRNAs hydrolase)